MSHLTPKVDRAPFLDHRLYEYSATRPKVGFAAPLAKWLRQELADWAEALVYGPELAAQSFVDQGRVADVWRLHKQGRGDYSFHLWGLLQLCAWQRMYRASW